MSRYRQSFNEALQQVEKWSKDVEVKSTGEHAGKTIDQLKKEVDALRGKPNNEKEMGGLLFAIRAKQGWKKGEGSTGVEEGTEGDALVKAVANSPKQQALKKKQMLGITPAGKKALKKGDHKLSITPKGKAAVEDMSLAPKGKGRKAAKALYKENEVTHFGDVLRQAIEEAKKVNAIDTINKIVKTKTMGKLHGQKVDLFTASAIQQVYKAINHKNKEKMNSVMSKDIHGLLKMADFSMSKMKR